MDIGERIREARKALDISQAELARRVRRPGAEKPVDASTIKRWELGYTSLDAAYLAPLASALGCSTDWLITGEGAGPAITGDAA